ncbi:MAG: cellulase family glycosylhydrolase [Rikenellaceae bacterium]
MKRIIISLLVTLSIAATTNVKAQNFSTTEAVAGRWSIDSINEWYSNLDWLVGCNYYPATAINQIDMWQESTWDPRQIEKELDWAQSIGMNTLRVYLHDMVWADDEKGLYKRMDKFLDICAERDIRPWFVFFDDCHYPVAKLGEQPLPVKGYHNSGWVNCPVRDVALRYHEHKTTAAEEAQLKAYVQRTIERFKDDDRVLLWELYNEPGHGTGENGDMGSSIKTGSSMGDKSARLVYDSWVWAREVNPLQPITSCTAGAIGVNNKAINRINSDLHSIHCYKSAPEFKALIEEYKADGRPVLMTEWLARTEDNTPEAVLEMMKDMEVGAVCWGFVSGKSGTIWPWSSRLVDGKPRNLIIERKDGNVVREGDAMPEPELWFHDLFRADGTPYKESEVELFRELTNN